MDDAPGIVFKYAPAVTRTTFASGLHLPTSLAFEPPTGASVNISTRAQVLTDDNVPDRRVHCYRNRTKRRHSARYRSLAGQRRKCSARLNIPCWSCTMALASNDNWMVTIQASGISPTDDFKAAIIMTLPAGAYTAIVSGKNGGTGVGLVEVYNLQ